MRLGGPNEVYGLVDGNYGDFMCVGGGLNFLTLLDVSYISISCPIYY